MVNRDGIHYSGSCQNDMSSFVRGQVPGERIAQMFEQAGLFCFLDYRESEPSWVQLKLGVCAEHLPKLEKLERLVIEAGRVITPEIIAEAVKG